MSAVDIDEAATIPDVCANCGREGSGEFKLKNCTACYLVRYCSAYCQKAHRPSHKKACKKRAAELHDEQLFGRGHDYFLGDCPFCCVPFPIKANERSYTTCCINTFCTGCVLAGLAGLLEACPFCRKDQSSSRVTDEMHLSMIRSRMDAGDAEAYDKLGSVYRLGNRGVTKDSAKAVGLWTRAARLGSVNAHCSLGCAYCPCTESYGVKKEKKMSRHHYEVAAMGGHHIARNNLGCNERSNGRNDLALKHFMIAAKIGYELSLTNIREMHAEGDATKDDYAEALIGYQNAINERSSPDRETAKKLQRLNSLMGIPPLYK